MRCAGGRRRWTWPRDRAAELDLAGAAFPWRTIRGEECSAYWPAGTANHRPCCWRRLGVEVVQPPETMEWGMRAFMINDCNGDLVMFADPSSGE